MPIGINDLDDDDILETGEQQPSQPSSIPEGQQEHRDSDYMSDFLRTKGIDDPSRINFEDDNGQIVERNWKDLSDEEKFNILNTPTEHEEYYPQNNLDLTDQEIALLSDIRRNNLTPEEYLQQISGDQIVQQPSYKIDDLTDDEVYLLDLESRVGELSDEDAAQALAVAKQQSEELYQKQVEGIRKEYKEREDFKVQQEQAEAEEYQRQIFERYQANVVDAIDNFNSIGNLDISFDDTDKETLAEFMLSQDEAGRNYLYEALQDPQTLVKAAWFILNGEDAFNSISDYFTNQIKLVSDSQYKKGLEDGKKGISSKPSVYIDNSRKTNRRTYNSINDLDDDD